MLKRDGGIAHSILREQNPNELNEERIMNLATCAAGDI